MLLVSLLVGLAAGASSAAAAPARAEVAELRTEYKVDPVGIDALRPRLSWKLRSEARGVRQTAYRIQVAADAPSFGRALWDTGQVSSDRSIHVPYEGPALQSSRRYHWRVRVWDGAGRPWAWSRPASFEMGLLAPGDWKAKWIEPGLEEDTSRSQPVPLLRGRFQVEGRVKSARAYVSALGLYEMEINGRRVGDELFTPGWTSYKHRVQYQTYDVTEHLRRGENVAGAMLGDGWYRGYLAWNERRKIYGERVALLAQLRIVYEDGRVQVVGTDDTWKAARGPILMSEIYMGETYDARLQRPGWSAPGFDDGGWSGVRLAPPNGIALIAPAGPPVRRIEEVRPAAIRTTPGGDTVVDFGQNLVGWVRLKVRGPAGTTVRLRHAEVLDKDGNFYTANLRAARQLVTYTLAGGAEEVYEPRFTFQGFRYVDVDGYPGELSTDSLTAVVVHSDMAVTGHFATSHPRLNQLQRNIVWGQKGNFLDVPTDCPQRDERLGWTGDAQVFARTAAFNMDVAAFFEKWLGDVAADQDDEGGVPHVVPDVLTTPDRFAGASAAWADAAVIIPWTMYLSYGDTRVLERQYPSMKAWVEYMRSQAGPSHLWNTGRHFGDWLAYAAPSSEARSYPGATTGKDLIATAFFAHSTDLLQRTAAVLGRKEDAAEYAALRDRIGEAFRKEFVTASGRVGENTQTAYALALRFGLLPEELRAEAAGRLAADVRTRRHLTTGFVGTPHLCHVLSDSGHLDVAYHLLNREAYPSWLYPVTQGATTIWERWDGQKPDGTFQDAAMNSFNHYAYGAIGEWMYRVVAGIEIDPQEPGYEHVLIQPRPGGGLTWVEARLETMYGRVASSWKLAEGLFQLTVAVPPNARATVRLPGATLADVTEGGRSLAASPGAAARQDGGAVVVEVGSGTYAFSYPATSLELPGPSLPDAPPSS
jgi:alpha-L-rhamnosidase